LGQRKSDVLKNVHVRPNGVGLKHHADFAFLSGNKDARHRRIDHTAADFDFAAVRPLQAGDAPKSRRLAATARTKQNTKITLGDFQIDIAESVNYPLLRYKTLAELSNTDQGKNPLETIEC
jgi:hypothetical protein